VHLADDLRHHRLVAVKILRPEVAAWLGSKRFLREIEIAAHLTHPHILPLYDSGDADGLVYYVMPYVDGESLQDRISEGPLPVDEALRIAREVADALAYAHEHGVVHRDIKPGNILLEAHHAVVSDFGIARAMVEAGGHEITSAGLIVGTPLYMSPEQASDGAVDGRSDIYSLGCVVYEMLTGHPPFSGSTPQAVAGRHLNDPPPSIRTTQPSVPLEVERAVAVALEKLPEDRFSDATQFAAALSDTIRMPVRSRARRRLQRRLGAAFCVLSLGGAAFWRFSGDSATLDTNRLVVFPIAGPSPATTTRSDDASLALVASLNSTSSLIGIDGGKLVGGRSRSAAASDRLARRLGAGYYIEGRLVASDSLRLLLDLSNIQDRTVTHRMISFPPGSDGWTVGVRAALEVLPLVIRTGLPPEVPSLVGRSPAALAEYFLGERDYRRAAFSAAVEHFQRAVAADSGFALAALRGAQAATWDARPTAAEAFVRVALVNASVLPLRQRVFAQGFDAWLKGRADTARQLFAKAITLDPTAAEPWMGLGETYNHLLPTESPLDSLAEDAYLRVNELDSTFVPVLFHLTEFAVRHGDRNRAERLLAQYRRAAPAADGLGAAELMLACVEDTMTVEAWQAAARRSPAQVSDAAQSFALGGLRQPGCARAAWEALLAVAPRTGGSGNYRFGAMLGLQGLLVAEGRGDEVRALLESDTLFRPALRGQLYVLAALAGAGFAKEANSYAEQARRLYRSSADNLSNIELWFLGTWLAHTGDIADAATMADLIQRRVGKGEPRRDSLLAASLRARVTLVSGDSSGALRQLRALIPTTASHSDLTWNPWESLPGERLLLAQLLLARNQIDEAVQVAANFDSPVPIVYLMYLPASLSLRVQGAERLGDPRLAQLSRSRLSALRSSNIARE
jgi:serine/threonine protein kinase/tetratricopeptide (TPR) repeat protein